MKKTRIVKRIHSTGCVDYQVQTKHWLFRWMWSPASLSDDYLAFDTFDTLKEAKAHEKYFPENRHPQP